MNWKKISLVRWSFVALAKLGLSGKGLVIAVPTLWLLIFFLIPFVFIAKISFSEAVIQQPPYLPLTIFNEEGVLQISLNFSNYQYLLEDTLYFLSYLASLRIAFFSTIFCLLIGYPLAYYIARSSEVKRNFLLLLIVLPFWTSFLLRIYAWIGILKTYQGYFNARTFPPYERRKKYYLWLKKRRGFSSEIQDRVFEMLKTGSNGILC